MVKNNLKNTTSGKKIDFPIPVSSYKMILIGFGESLLRSLRRILLSG